MRHLLTSFLALHWAVVFALLAFICIDGSRGPQVALSVLGAPVLDAGAMRLDSAFVVAPLATGLLVVAVTFCWAFVEALVNGSPAADGTIRIAFITAAGMLSVVLVGGSVQGITGLFPAVSVNLAALLTSYLAICAERWSTSRSGVPDREEIRVGARAMAREAAHGSRLARISGRPGAAPAGAG